MDEKGGRGIYNSTVYLAAIRVSTSMRILSVRIVVANGTEIVLAVISGTDLITFQSLPSWASTSRSLIW